MSKKGPILRCPVLIGVELNYTQFATPLHSHAFPAMHLIRLVPNGKLEDLSLLSHLPRLLVSHRLRFVRLEDRNPTRTMTLLIDEKFVSFRFGSFR